MLDIALAPVCGLYCGSCDYFGKQCLGCGHVSGRPFWMAQTKDKVCPLHNCCSDQKQLEHCGLCDECPCPTFTGLRDPALGDEEAKQALIGRQNELAKRKEIGTGGWLEEKSKGESKRGEASKYT